MKIRDPRGGDRGCAAYSAPISADSLRSSLEGFAEVGAGSIWRFQCSEVLVTIMDDNYVLDSSDPVRGFFGIRTDDECRNLLLVTVRDSARANRLYIANSVTQLLVRNNNFRITCSADGEIYVLTDDAHDADVLDGQTFTAFGDKVVFERVSNVLEEFRVIEESDDVTFKLFERKSVWVTMFSSKGKGLLGDEAYTVDVADPIRKYLGLWVEEERKHLLVATILDVIKLDACNVDEIYVVTSVTQLLLGNYKYKVMCSAQGEILVQSKYVNDCLKLHGQKFIAFGTVVQFDMGSHIESSLHLGESDDDDEFFCSSDGAIDNEISDHLGFDDSLFELYKQHKLNSLKKRLGSSLMDDIARMKVKKVRTDSAKKAEVCHFYHKYFGDVIHSLSAHQISIIEGYGFGYLLKFQNCSVPKNFVKWIASVVDVRTSELIIKDRVIGFSKQSVHKILGLPVGGQVLCSDIEAGSSFLLSKFKLQNLEPIQFYGDKLKSNEDMSDDEVFLCFMVVAISCFICPGSSFLPRTEFMEIFEQPLQVRSYDWSLHIYDLVLKYVMKLIKQPCIAKKGSHVFSAASYVLAVLYLDCVDFGSYKVSNEIPRICYWNGPVLKYCSELDQINSLKFGRRPLKVLIDTSYSESFFKFDESIANGMMGSAVPTEFKSKLESLYGDILPDELKYGICNIYASHFTEEAKRMNLSCQALIFKIFSFCNDLSAKVNDVTNDVEVPMPCDVPDRLKFLSEHVHGSPTVNNMEVKPDDVDEDLDLSLKCGLNVNTSNVGVPSAQNSKLAADVGNIDEKVGNPLFDNGLMDCQKVVHLSTPGFIMNRNISSSAPSQCKADHVVKQKMMAKGQVIGRKSSLFDLNSSAKEFASENFRTPSDHIIEVDTVKKIAEVEEIFAFGHSVNDYCRNVSADGSRIVFDVESQQYVRVRNDVHKQKFVSKNAGFLSKLQIADLNVSLQPNEQVFADKISSGQVQLNHVPDSLPAEHCDKASMLCRSKAPIVSEKDVVLLPDSDDEQELAVRQIKPVPLIHVDEEEEKNGFDVKFMGEVNFKNKITAMCNKSDILYNNTLAPGPSCLIRDCEGPSVAQPAANDSKFVRPAFEQQGVCRPQAWSKKYVLTDKQRRNYLAACRLASSTKWNDENAVEIGGCYVKFRELGNSMRTGCKAILLKGSGSLTYVKKCFDGATSVLALHKADMLLFPICHDDHWFVFVVDIKNSLFGFLDSFYSGDDDYHTYVRSNLIPSFKTIWSQLVQGPLDFDNFDVVYPPVPKQNNLVDCGVFVIMFLTFWTWYCGLCIDFSQDDIDNIRIHTVSNLVCSEHNVAYSSPITNYFGPGSFPRVVWASLIYFQFCEGHVAKGSCNCNIDSVFNSPSALLIEASSAPSDAISDAIFDRALNMRTCDCAGCQPMPGDSNKRCKWHVVLVCQNVFMSFVRYGDSVFPCKRETEEDLGAFGSNTVSLCNWRRNWGFVLICFPEVLIDGPYGAPSQDYQQYDVVLLVGLGIGATPMISIIKDIVNNMKKLDGDLESGAGGAGASVSPPLRTQRAYFYWVTPEQGSYDWFRSIMDEVAEKDRNGVIELHNHCTSVYEKGDARSALIAMLQSLNRAKGGVDVVSGTRVRTHFGRPNWRNVYKRIAVDHRDQRVASVLLRLAEADEGVT
ncbi:hypothetical protein ACP70R_008226 [Stipagrostis hirtigluma subsp. patula]